MFTYILGTVYKREGGFTCLLILYTRGKEGVYMFTYIIYKREGGVYMFTYILGTVYKREGGGLHVYLYYIQEGRRGFTCLLIYLTLFTRGKEGVYMFTYILDTVYKCPISASPKSLVF